LQQRHASDALDDPANAAIDGGLDVAALGEAFIFLLGGVFATGLKIL